MNIGSVRNEHPSGAFITCCVKKRGLKVCAECSDLPCPRFKADEEYQQVKESSSYPSYQVVMRNLDSIRTHGLKQFIDRQKKRIRLLEDMIADFDDGRSKSFFCRAACLHDLASLESALHEAPRRIKADKITPEDAKAKAKTLREILA